MKLKPLIDGFGRAVYLDAERVIAIIEQSPRIVYREPHRYEKENQVEIPLCCVFLDGESASNDSSQGIAVRGTPTEVLNQLGLTLS